MSARSGTKQNVHIRHAEVRVDDEHPMSPFLKCNRKVDGKVGFPDPSLAARNRDHTYIRPSLRLCRRDRRSGCRTLRADHLAQPRCLICHIISSIAAPPGDLPSRGECHPARSARSTGMRAAAHLPRAD